VIADDLPAALAGVPAAWRAVLPGWNGGRFEDVVRRIQLASRWRPIAPEDPFRALRFAAPGDVKVVVFGQDPYPRPGHADGLAFSCARGNPPSLRRIFDILEADRPGWRRPAGGALDGWARQGVLLLNPVLTVEVGRAGAHMKCGWQALTSEIVSALCGLPAPPVFMLWGRPAGEFFDAACTAGAGPPPRVLRSRHPSHDFKREFIAGGSHFAATADLVDWWSIGDPAAARVRPGAILAGSPEGCPSG
jgi:uracil-DNA glycosylase